MKTSTIILTVAVLLFSTNIFGANENQLKNNNSTVVKEKSITDNNSNKTLVVVKNILGEIMYSKVEVEKFGNVLVANKGADVANIADPSLNQISQHLEGQVVNRGDDSKNDWYLIGGFFVTYVFADNGLVGARKKNRRGKGCYD